MSGINGPCNRACNMGRPHELDCHNYIEIDLPCPVCSTPYGRQAGGCLMARVPVSHDHDPGGCTCGCPVKACPPCGGFPTSDVSGSDRG